MSTNEIARPPSRRGLLTTGTRRSFLAGASTAAVAGGGSAVALAQSTPEIDRLWTAVLEVHAEGVVLSREIWEAEARLPWWAAPGPKYLVAEGEPERPERADAPAIQGMERPSRHTFKLLRPTPGDIERDYALRVRYAGSSESARELYERLMAEYHERCEARKLERQKLGIPAMEARQEAKDDSRLSIEMEIDRLPASVNVVAARVLLTMTAHSFRHNTLEDGDHDAAAIALSGLRPLLSGPVAATVADFLDHPERPFCYSPLWGSYWPADLKPEANPWGEVT